MNTQPQIDKTVAAVRLRSAGYVVVFYPQDRPCTYLIIRLEDRTVTTLKVLLDTVDADCVAYLLDEALRAKEAGHG